MRAAAWGVLLVTIFMVLVPVTRVAAQDPTPTATPGYISEVEISQGVTLLLERKVTYGEISVVIAAGILALILVIPMVVNWSKQWLK